MFKLLVYIFLSFICCTSLSAQEDSNASSAQESSTSVLLETQPISLYSVIDPDDSGLLIDQERSNQEWLKTSIYQLSFWRTEQKFLGMTLCEPISFDWEVWGDNKYSDLNRYVKDMEYQRFISLCPN